MTTPATASSLREAISPEALTRARRRLLTAHPDPTSSDTSAPGSLIDEQLRLLAASDWVPPRIDALDGNTIATADPIHSGRSWPNQCTKASNGDSSQNAPTAPMTTRVQDMTPSVGEWSTTTTW